MPSGKKDKSLKKKYSLFFRNRRDIPEPEPEPENSMEGIYPSLKEFKKCLYKIERETLETEGYSSEQRLNASHELRVIRTRLRVQRILLYVIKIEREINNDRRLPLQDREGNPKD